MRINVTNQNDDHAKNEHRRLGRKIMSTDLDSLEYHYDGTGKLIFDAVIDYKYGKNASQSPVSTRRSCMQAQRQLAESIGIPFFCVITYLDQDPPMYLVVGANQQATEFLHGINRIKTPGIQALWMTPYCFSKFQHSIRKIAFDPNEENQQTGEKLSELSNRRATYLVPRLEIEIDGILETQEENK